MARYSVPRKGGTVQRNCECCGNSYGVGASRAGHSRFCSKQCKYEFGRVQCTCGACGKTYTAVASHAPESRWCSKACMSAGIAAARPQFDCENCRKRFTVPPSKLNAGTPRFCTYTCCAEYRRRTGETARPKSRVTKCCEVCGKNFEVRTSQSHSRFCSNECMWTWRGPIISEKRYQPDARTTVKCAFCGTEFTALHCSIRGGRSVFCSRQCNGSASVRKQGRGISRVEDQFSVALEQAGLSPIRQHRIGRWLVDFYFPAENLIVEFDGEYWHGTPAGIARDKRKDADMAARGVRMLRIRERLWMEKPEEAVSLVQSELRGAA